jgi:hypothetical protein
MIAMVALETDGLVAHPNCLLLAANYTVPTVSKEVNEYFGWGLGINQPGNG